MSPWIDLNTSLTGNTIDLAPLEPEHFPGLATLALDKRIWEFYPFDCSNADKFTMTLETALLERDKGTQLPFAIIHKTHGNFIGGTRILNIQQNHRKFEIGWTWLTPEYWGTAANLECKLLLMTFGFEILRASRIQLTTDENNERSRRAIEKIGGKFEGIIRNDMIRASGTIRHSAMYSIIDTEWKMVKAMLISRYREKAGTTTPPTTS